MIRTGRLRSLLANTLLAVVSSALFLGVLEGISRHFEKTSPDETAEKLALWEKAWKSDFYLMTSHSPGWPPNAPVNRDGLPDRLHTEQKAEGTYRLAILGDSVTAGTPFAPSESWPYFLQAQADERGPFVEVMNASLWGWSTRQELTAYRTIVRRYRPDSVVVALCLNDIEELQNNLSRPSAFLGWLHRRSALVRRIVNAEGRSIRMVEELLQDSPNVRAGFERLFAELGALAREVRADGATLTVVVLPMQSQASGSATSRLPQERIREYCQRERIGFVDPLPALAGHGDFFEDIVHLTVDGRRLLARSLLGVLVPSDRLARIPVTASAAKDAAVPSEDARDRAEVAWVLGRVVPFDPATPARLAWLLVDPAPLVRATAASALVRLGPQAQGALGAILSAMDDPSPTVRWRATEALVAVQPEERSVSAIARHLTSHDIYVRSGAAFALQELGPGAREALPGLRQLLSDDDEGVRAMAVQAVAAVGRGDSSSAEAFLAILAGPAAEGNARWKAARALGRMGGGAAVAVPALVRAIDDPNGHVRREAASALGRIGVTNANALEAVIRASRDEWPPVRRAAATALGRLGCADVTATDRLRALAEDQAAEVREAAAEALLSCKCSAPAS